RHTAFKGEASPFIMELPSYHLPKPKAIWRHTWFRLKDFILRAGKIVVIMVTILGVLNSVGTNGSIGNEDSENSLLSAIGKKITPVFEPFGVEEENWPASVALFTGLFAKEAIVGTLNSLYSINDAENAEPSETEETSFNLFRSFSEAFLTIPENLLGTVESFVTPLGVEKSIEEAKSTTFSNMKERFTLSPIGFNFQVFAYLLFILLYVPCLAALGTAFRELGKFYGTVLVIIQTLLGWSLSVLLFQVTVGHSVLWIAVSVVALILIVAFLKWLGLSKHKIN
ncbi:MAG: nucleoside recognition domain-containing protein, partial [Fibrobacteraceae bacterium]|nr:nucleoside recognition domain-containing protein [Fibrobacteraceae bacterium]